MKLATFRAPSSLESIGVVIGPDVAPRVLDLRAAAHRLNQPQLVPSGMLQVIERGERALEAIRQIVLRTSDDAGLSYPLHQIKLLAPVPEPPQIRDFSVFPGHIRSAPSGMARIAARKAGDAAAAAAVRPLDQVPDVYRERPIYYITNRFSVSGSGAKIVWPAYSKLMDFELEFGVFLSKNGRNVKAESARDYIFGYTIYNDFSARDTQFEEMQGMLGPTKGKSFDAGNVIGPWIVTADEIPDPYALKMSARVNGETWTATDSSGMLHTFEDMIAYVSRHETLRAGEFFGSGTVGGGCGLEIDRWLKNGDVVELEVEKIGILRNQIVSEENAEGTVDLKTASAAGS